MNKFESFQQFLTSQSTQVVLSEFIANLILTAALASALGALYIKYGRALSNRKLFARHFVLLACTTMIIITIVKSSLALSLGLVGALSIVRFRSAIKEPEELTYLFVTICLGLGFGAGQRMVTTVGFAVVAAIIVLRDRKRTQPVTKSLVLTLNDEGPEKLGVDQMVPILKEVCSQLDLKRFDETKNEIEASFLIECEDFQKLSEGKRKLQQLSQNLKISLCDYAGAL